jgi:hypothetical protein
LNEGHGPTAAIAIPATNPQLKDSQNPGKSIAADHQSHALQYKGYGNQGDRVKEQDCI